jgi:6-phosphogluconolactonase (cycloisomerase 2 family)
MYKLLLLCTFFRCFIGRIEAATIGSDTAPSRFNTQQTLKTGDRVAGFAALAGGLKLFDYNTAATFDSFFAVSGRLALNGGSLVLTRDLILNDVASIDSLGNIIGNDHIFLLPPNISNLVTGDIVNCNVSFTSTTVVNTLSQIINFQDWSYQDLYLALALQATTNQVAVYQFNSPVTTFTTAVTPSGSVVNAVAWHPFRNTLAVASQGSPQLFLYSYSLGTGLVFKDSEILKNSAARSLAWHPSGNYIAVGDNSSAITIVPVSGSDVLDKVNTYTLQTAIGGAFNSIDWDITGSYLATAGNNGIGIYQFSTSPLLLTFKTNQMFDNGIAVSWNQQFENIVAAGGQGGRLYIYRYNTLSGTLSLLANDNSISSSVLKMQWNPECGMCLACTDNRGTGELRTYLFDSITNALTLINNYNGNNTRYNAMRWQHSGNYLASGANNNNTNYTFILQSALSSLPTCFTFLDIQLYLSNNVSLDNVCLTFSGRSFIRGNGNILDFGATSTISIARGSTLTFSDITLNNIHESNLKCLDNLATLSLINTVIVLDNNYTFTQGKLDIVDNVVVSGNNIFEYKSDQALTINRASKLTMLGSALSYIPTTSSSQLITFVDQSSQLYLLDATIYASAAGLSLIKGSLIVEGFSSLIADGTNVSQAISFGNGINRVNNMTIEFLPAGVLSCNGFIINNNV